LNRYLRMLPLLALYAAPLQAESLLTPHKATYKVKISVLGGQLDTELRQTATGYSATHIIKPTGMSRMFARGSIVETSHFDSVSDGVRPREYVSRDTLSREKENATIHFDWDNGEARGTVNGSEVVSVIDSLAHDRVSIQYEVMHDLMSGDASAKYTMFEIDRLRPVNVQIIGEKIVKVPAGEFQVIGVQHQAEGSKRITTLWCAEQLGYLPVVIEQHRNGKLQVRAKLEIYTPTSGQ
jgi:hypothetical protein